MPSNKKLLQAAAGNAGGDNLYVEDVFSTYLYTGTGSAQSIDNGIPLSDEGGLVWIKSRSNADSHYLFDTVNGPEETISSDDSNAGANYSAYWDFPSAGTTGFNLKAAPGNYSGWTMASWTFRKAEKFFDVVAYTGTGSAQNIAHNLGSVPACIMVKNLTDVTEWKVYHIDSDPTTPANKYLRLNSTAAVASGIAYWNDTEPTDSIFTVGSNNDTNGSGDDMVAYLFASDAGGFGDDGDESIIKCGTFTTDGTQTAEVTGLGWEPQYVLFKNVNLGNNWQIHDSMRGMPWGSYTYLAANSSGAEVSGAAPVISPTPDGFLVNNANYNQKSIYIAIRRPMKTPESGTEVFAIDTYGSTGDGLQPGFRSTFPVDMALRVDTSVASNEISSRLTQGKWMYTDLTNAEASQSLVQFDYQNGWFAATGTASNYYSWMLKRATGFMDVVAYSGTGSATTQTHNLGVVPELMIVKTRSTTSNWPVYSAALTNTDTLFLNFPDATTSGISGYWNSTTPTDSVFSLGTANATNGSSRTFIAYLFATLAGVSKVGSYTGTGADLNVDCGFSAGARFILIKRTDSTGDWYVWDSARGIVAGNDPYLLLNTTAAEVTNTDYIDPLNAGFTVTSSASSTVNVSSGSYIFLAIA